MNPALCELPAASGVPTTAERLAIPEKREGEGGKSGNDGRLHLPAGGGSPAPAGPALGFENLFLGFATGSFGGSRGERE